MLVLASTALLTAPVALAAEPCPPNVRVIDSDTLVPDDLNYRGFADGQCDKNGVTYDVFGLTRFDDDYERVIYIPGGEPTAPATATPTPDSPVVPTTVPAVPTTETTVPAVATTETTAPTAAPPTSTAPAGSALTPTDPFVGLWQRGSVIVDVLATGEARVVSDPVACRIGEVHSKDFLKVTEGQYTVSNGNFGDKGCSAGSFTPGFTLQVAGDVLSIPGGSTYNRLPSTALAPTDPILGSWQSPDGTSVNEVRADGSVRIRKGPACRVGMLDSYDLKPTEPGTYTVRNGTFTTGACAASSFPAGFTLTVGPDGLRPGGGTGAPWTRVDERPATDKESLLVIHHNISGARVPCGVLVTDKGDEGQVQELIDALGLAKPGLYSMKPEKAVELDTVMLRKNAENELTEDLYKPMIEAAQKAAVSPTSEIVPIDVGDDAEGAFRGVCVRRS